MFTYKINILAELKKHGYSTYRLRKEKLMGEFTIQQIRHGKMVGIETLDTICTILNCCICEVIQHEKPTE